MGGTELIKRICVCKNDFIFQYDLIAINVLKCEKDKFRD